MATGVLKTRDIAGGSLSQPTTFAENKMKIISGCIYYLSKIKKTSMAPYESDKSDHPVLIINSSPSDPDVQACLLTTFGNRSICERFPLTSPIRKHFYAIGDTPGFDGKPSIQTTDNSIFNGYQYIRIKHTFPVPKIELRPFKYSTPNNPPAITKESWSTLRRAIVKQNLPCFDIGRDAWASHGKQKPYGGSRESLEDVDDGEDDGSWRIVQNKRRR